MKRLLLTLAMTGLASSAFAQAPQVDPRVSAQTIAAMQALMNLRDAQITAMQQDFKKREDEWAAYSAPLWKSEKEPPATAAEPPSAEKQ
jgi:hypothetical protein